MSHSLCYKNIKVPKQRQEKTCLLTGRTLEQVTEEGNVFQEAEWIHDWKYTHSSFLNGLNLGCIASIMQPNLHKCVWRVWSTGIYPAAHIFTSAHMWSIRRSITVKITSFQPHPHSVHLRCSQCMHFHQARNPLGLGTLRHCGVF